MSEAYREGGSTPGYPSETVTPHRRRRTNFILPGMDPAERRPSVGKLVGQSRDEPGPLRGHHSSQHRNIKFQAPCPGALNFILPGMDSNHE